MKQLGKNHTNYKPYPKLVKYRFGLALFLLQFTLPLNQAAADGEILKIEFQAADFTTFNPGLGLALTAIHHENTFEGWYREYVPIAYKRFHWSMLEPTADQYTFEELLGVWIRKWRFRQFRVGLGVMSCSLEGQSMPEWAFAQGVPSVSHVVRTGPHKGRTIRNPIFWDEAYLKLHKRFVRALGKYLEGGRYLEYIDMRGTGTWGEMHLIGYSKADLRTYGFDPKRYAQVYQELIDAYRTAFPNTQILLNLGHLYVDMLPYLDVADYAARHGVGFRFDGLAAEYTHNGQYIARQLFRKYSRTDLPGVPIVPCLYEFARLEKNPNIIAKCFDNATADRATYLHLNIGSLDCLPQIVADQIKKFSRKIGYRLSVDSVQLPAVSRISEAGGSVPVEIQIRNSGIAPVPFDGICEMVLEPDTGKKALMKRETVLLRSIAPQTSQIIKISFRIPTTIASGRYKLKLSIAAMAAFDERLILANNGQDRFKQLILAYTDVTKEKDNTILSFRGKTGESKKGAKLRQPITYQTKNHIIDRGRAVKNGEGKKAY